jgi:hypothetical protein
VNLQLASINNPVKGMAVVAGGRGQFAVLPLHAWTGGNVLAKEIFCIKVSWDMSWGAILMLILGYGSACWSLYVGTMLLTDSWSPSCAADTELEYIST